MYHNDPKFSDKQVGQTVLTQKLLLEEQSDQGLHCLLFYLYHLELYTMVRPCSLNFKSVYSKVSECLKN